MKRFAIRYLLPLFLLLLGVICAGALRMAKPKAQRRAQEEVALPVEVLTAQFASLPVRLQASGVVSAAQEVTVSPEIGGKVVWVSPNLIPGARVAAGEALIRLDDRAAKIAVRQRRAQVESAELEFALEVERGLVAAKEWEILGRGGAAPQLAQRAPQREAVEAAMDSARAALEGADLDLARTQVRAPFDALIGAEYVDVGMVLGVAAKVADLVGLEEVRVAVPMPMEQLQFVQIPGVQGVVGSRVIVRQRVGDASPIERQGEVRTLGARLDSATRTASLLVSVADPMPPGALPLLPGAYVEVEVLGTPQEVVSVPRQAVEGGDAVWTVGPDSRLIRKEVIPLWGDREALYLASGVSDGDIIVLTPLRLPMNGTLVAVGGPRL